MKIYNELEELVEKAVLTEETAHNIKHYYHQKDQNSPNQLYIIFGILGAILVGLGIILIIAHNWDNFPTGLKTVFAFIPLALGQLLALYVILKKYSHMAWREGVATFLFFAISVSISLVSQIYHISGAIESFMLTWMLLALPLIYLLDSSVACLLYLSGITFYACLQGYFNYPTSPPYLYGLLLIAALPFYIYQVKKKNRNIHAVALQNWTIALSFLIVLGAFSHQHQPVIYISYICMFAFFLGLYPIRTFKNATSLQLSYAFVGYGGTLVILFILSFREGIWDSFTPELLGNRFFTSPEFLLSLAFSLAASYFVFQEYIKAGSISKISPYRISYLLCIALFFTGIYLSLGAIIINMYLLMLGLYTIRLGNKKQHLGILNFGLSIITVLIICRFFDTNLSFITRGILFLLVGAGFFIANYLTLKRKKQNAQ